MSRRLSVALLAVTAVLAAAARGEDRATASSNGTLPAAQDEDHGGRLFDGSVANARAVAAPPEDGIFKTAAPRAPTLSAAPGEISDLKSAAPPAPSAARFDPLQIGVLNFLGAAAADLGIKTPLAKPVPEPSIGKMDLGPLTFVRKNAGADSGASVGKPVTVPNKEVLLHYAVPAAARTGPPRVFSVDQSLLARLQFWKPEYSVSPEDVEQGDLGDCYLLASLAEIARQQPDTLLQMVLSLDDDPARTWVKFWMGSPPAAKLVGPLDDKFPVYQSGILLPDGKKMGGRAVFARPTGAQKPLWPLIVEKAYTIAFRKDAYAQTDTGGVASQTMTHLTGLPSTRFEIDPGQPNYRPVSFDDLARWNAARLPIVIGTKNKPSKGCAKAAAEPGSMCRDPLYFGLDACSDGDRDPACASFRKDKDIPHLVDGHYYWLKGLDASTRSITLGNPWGGTSPEVTWPWERFKLSLDDVDVNGISDGR